MITDHALLNAVNSDEAHWRATWDMGVAWLALDTLNPMMLLGSDRVLMLRRYSGNKYPQPEAAPVVGYARNATTVRPGGTSTYANNATYFHYVDIATAGGVVSEGTKGQALPVLWGGGTMVPIPNRPIWLQANQSDDGLLILTWLYDGVDEQATPGSFDIFTDSGTGTMSASAYASVAFESNRTLYAWKAGAGVGSDWKWQVRAKSGSSLSFAATTPSGGSGQDVGYSVGAVDIRLTTRKTLFTTAPTAPVAPEFAG